jgi:TetR/AcrR family transcriptional regulator, tetracycline repressor protein
MTLRSQRGRPPLISRESVVTRTLALIDEHGVDELSMRRLGSELGVDPMAVYHYFPDKAALLDAVVERLYGEVGIPARDGDWEEDFREIARRTRASMLRHGGALVLLATRPPSTPEAFGLIDACASVLLDAGLSERDAADGVDCLGRLLIGHLVAEAGVTPGADADDDVEDRHAEAQAALGPERFPGLTAIGGASVVHDPGRLFEIALEGLVLVLRARTSHNRKDPNR